jgi:competence protein ComEA
MNPFIKDPVAQPLGAQATERWHTPAKRSRATRVSRRAGMAMIAAGLVAVTPSQALDVNTASVSQLESLRGIGPRTAKMIVHERSRAGAFESMEDLSDRVRGLGERRVSALRQAGLEVKSSKAGLPLTVESVAPSKAKSSGTRPSNRTSSDLIAKPEIISPSSF